MTKMMLCNPMSSGLTRTAGVLASIGISLLFWAGPTYGALTVDIATAYNLVVDSNVTSPATYGPNTALITAKICNNDLTVDLTDVSAFVGNFTANTPGIYPVVDSDDGQRPAGWTSTHLNNTGEYSLTHEAGTAGLADATRYIGTLPAQECRTHYWFVRYPRCVNVDRVAQEPPCNTSIAGGVKPDDDLSLSYDVWATADGPLTTSATRTFTMRNEISAAANKIWPNTASKVPDAYLEAIESVLGWDTLGPDGRPLSDTANVLPGEYIITTQGIWYDLGNVVHGFDNNNDLIVDQNAWLQPIGDAGSIDLACFRLLRTYGLVIVKLKTGGEQLIPFLDQPYFESLPDNTGVVGLVYYQFIATQAGCSGNLTPYQEAASGYDNEKFSSDFGLSLGISSGEYGTDLIFTKTDGVSSTSPGNGNTLTYTIGATNNSGVNLGAPEFGLPLVIRETIPPDTTFVVGSADDSPSSNLTEPSGTGSFTQGYTDVNDELDTCTINYSITSSTYVVRYSTDNGTSWTTTEPGSGVTDIEWRLSTTLVLDGGHDGTACVAPNGTYDDGTVQTSLPNGQIGDTVRFEVTVGDNAGPVICNTSGLGFGGSSSAVEATDCTLVTGNNTLSGTVFRDDGLPTGIFGNGFIDGTETGIGAGVRVTLYYDLNGNGKLDSADVQYATTTTGDDPGTPLVTETGWYEFTNLTDGPYLVVAKKYDAATTDDATDSTFSTAGWGNTTSDPNLALTTDQGILKMTEDFATVTLAVNIDLDHSSAGPDSVTDVNFGFAPPLVLTKSVAGNPDVLPTPTPDGTADTPIDEGSLFTYNITIENRLPSVGVQGATGCEYIAWAPAGATGTQSGKEFTSPGLAYDSRSPNRTYAYADVDGGALRWIYGNNLSLAQQQGTITRVEALYFGYFSAPLQNDTLEVRVGISPALGNDGISGNINFAEISTALIESYVGEPADLDPNNAISWDITGLRPPIGSGSWTWTDFANTYIQVNPDKDQGADNKTFFIDAIGLRVTTDADCQAATSTTLSPVPLQDDYDETRVAFVSANPAPTGVNPSTGIIEWDDVGPIPPGSSKTVTVTVRALNVNGTVNGICPGGATCNTATTNYSGGAKYADGRDANNDDDDIAVTIQGKAELRGIVWNDSNNSGWPRPASGEPGIPNVGVTLFACYTSATSQTLEVGTGNNKTCASWRSLATTTTDANGNYEFIGLDSGYYIVEVGDTNGVPDTGNSAPYGSAQTAEPNDNQSLTLVTAPATYTANGTNGICAGGCNNTWGNPAANLRADQTTINFLAATTEETVSGINFGYYSNPALNLAALYGKAFHDIDGDAVYPPEPGESGLSGFTVHLYQDIGGDGTPDGSPIATTTTDANGNYSFSNINVATLTTYVVQVIPATLTASAWVETVESTGGTGSLNNQIPVTLAAGTLSGSHDFGYTIRPTSRIGDTLYYDFNGNGTLDTGEAGVPNVPVQIYRDEDRDGTIDTGTDFLLTSASTDSSGNYLFQNLAEGCYVVKVDTTDPDFPSASTQTGDPDTNAARIGDRVWLDVNNDQSDAGEDGLPGVVMLLYADNGNGTFGAGDQVIASTRTDLNGNYLFGGLNAGNYFVDIDTATLPSGLTRTTAAPTDTLISLLDRTSASAWLTANVGYRSATNYALGNRVWYDANNNTAQDPGEAGIAGVAISVSGSPSCSPTACTTTTRPSGFWIITGLANGTYTVTASGLPTGFTRTNPAVGPTFVISGAGNMAADYGYWFSAAGAPVGTISGSVFRDADGDGVLDTGPPSEAMGSTTVNLFREDGSLVATTATDASGAYSFTGVPVGTYRVQAVDTTGARFSTIFLSAGATVTGVKVIYSAASQTTPDNQSSVCVDGIRDNLMQDFGYRRFTSSIGDTVYRDANRDADQDFGEPGIAGVTVRLYDWNDINNNRIVDPGEQAALTLLQTQTTSADDPLTVADEGGKYLFTNLSGLETYPARRVIDGRLDLNGDLVVDANDDGVYFGYTIIDGYVDISGDASITNADDGTIAGYPVIDGGIDFNGVGGVTVADDGTIQKGGHYYLVQVDTGTLPTASFTLTADPDADGVPCTASPPAGTCDNQQGVVAFSPGVNYLGADFGYDLDGSGYGVIGDTVWIDGNANGVKDSGEAGLPNVRVYFDDDSDGVLDWPDSNGNGRWDSGEGERWVETNSNGYYVFTEVTDGSYTVRVVTGDLPAELQDPARRTYEAGGNLDNYVTVTMSGGAVTQIDGNACSGCDLNVDFGYSYAGNNTLSGTLCIEEQDDPAGVGYCGATATTYSGVASGSEAPLAAIPVLFLRWNDDGDSQAWAPDGTLDSGDTFTLLGSTSTDANGDYSYDNLPNNVIVVFGVSPSAQLNLTTDNNNSSVEGATKAGLYEGLFTLPDGTVVTILARQALQNLGTTVQDVDFAFKTVGNYDFGDLPEAGSPGYNATLLTSGGAHHVVGEVDPIYLGAGVTTEVDGKPDTNALGDDLDDGITLDDPNWRTGPAGASVTVAPSRAGWLAGWIDFDGDGKFNGPLEQVVNQAVPSGNSSISLFVPTSVTGSRTFFSRFRIYPEEPILVSSTGLALDSTFQATTGEVEDYKFDVSVTYALVSDFQAYVDGGQTIVEWQTGVEIGTVGFYLERRDGTTGPFSRLSNDLLPSVLEPQGGVYRFVDPSASLGETYTYRLIEVETDGKEHTEGPFTVTVASAPSDPDSEPWPEIAKNGYVRKGHAISAEKQARIAAAKSSREFARAKRKGRFGQAAKLYVTDSGLYRVTSTEIASLLRIKESEAKRWIQLRRLALTSGGDAVPYYASAENDRLYFYGQALRSPYAKENVYWLKVASGTPMALAPGPRNGPQASGEEFYMRTLHLEENRAHSLGLDLFEPEDDFWLWQYLIAGNPTLGRGDFVLSTPFVTSAGDAHLHVRLLGATETAADPDHHVRVLLNGTVVGEGSWNGQTYLDLELDVDSSLLQAGDNTLRIEALLNPGVAFSIFYVDYIDLTYPSLYQTADNTLAFTDDSNSVIEVEGFTEAQIHVLDVTDPEAPTLPPAEIVKAGSTDYRLVVRPPTPGRSYLAVAESAVRVVDEAVADIPSDLRKKSQRVDYLVIAPEEVSLGAAVLAAYRQSGGLSSLVVNLEDIMDEFNDGISSPWAIRDFLAYAHANWNRPPLFVALVGEGTADYKNVTGQSDNLVPTVLVRSPFGLVASDNRLADVAGGDGLPEMAIGRLPVVSEQELSDYIDKLEAHEGDLEGDWNRRVLMIADNADVAGNFPQDSRNLTALIGPDYDVEEVYMPPYNGATARARIIAAINGGVGLVNYIGHGSTAFLANEKMLQKTDVGALVNGSETPVMLFLTCAVGKFELPGFDSLAEVLVLRPGGGAVATWAPTGLSVNEDAVRINGEFFHQYFELGERRLGTAVTKALRAAAPDLTWDYELDLYNVLGDPAALTQ